MATDQPTDARSTETTDPVETVMAAADDYARCRDESLPHQHAQDRLRLHVQLALAKAYRNGQDNGCIVWHGDPHEYEELIESDEQIATLEARVQED